MSVCSVPVCDRPSKTRGLCGAHAERARTGASLDTPVRTRAELSTLYATPSGCWEWAGRIDKATGYGRFGHQWAHRAVYESRVGPIPAGMHLDHLCRHLTCVNPAHLEPVSPRENFLRGEALGAVTARTNICKRGHVLTAENVYLRSNGRRMCRPCSILRNRLARGSA